MKKKIYAEDVSPMVFKYRIYPAFENKQEEKKTFDFVFELRETTRNLWNALVKEHQRTKAVVYNEASKIDPRIATTIEQIERLCDYTEILYQEKADLTQQKGLKTFLKKDKELIDLKCEEIAQEIKDVREAIDYLRTPLWAKAKKLLTKEAFAALQPDFYKVAKAFNLDSLDIKEIVDRFTTSRENFLSNPKEAGPPTYKGRGEFAGVSIMRYFNINTKKGIFTPTFREFLENKWAAIQFGSFAGDYFEPGIKKKEFRRRATIDFTIKIQNRKSGGLVKGARNPNYKQEILKFSAIMHRFPPMNAKVAKFRISRALRKNRPIEWYLTVTVEMPKASWQIKSSSDHDWIVMPDVRKTADGLNLKVADLMADPSMTVPVILPGPGCFLDTHSSVKNSILTRNSYSKEVLSRQISDLLNETKEKLSPFLKRIAALEETRTLIGDDARRLIKSLTLLGEGGMWRLLTAIRAALKKPGADKYRSFNTHGNGSRPGRMGAKNKKSPRGEGRHR